MYDLTGLLEQAAEEVLESMFFAGVLGELDAPAGGQRLCAMVVFTGTSNGEFRVSAPRATAVVLAAGFLGSEDDEVPDSQVRAIVGEFANVLCGVVLGRMNPSGNFAISAPEVTDGDDAGAAGTIDLRRRFELLEGDLSVGLTVH
jgi:CheY-specific phosphatase CheX